MAIYTHSILASNQLIAADGDQVFDLPVQPLSAILLHISPLNATSTIANYRLLEALLGAVTTIRVSWKGDPIFNLSGVDAAALALLWHRATIWQSNAVETDDDRRSIVLPIIFGRRAFMQDECFPRSLKGELRMTVTFDIAATGFDGLRISIETIELPGAEPSSVQKASALAQTFAATGQNEIDLPIGNVLRGILLFGTTGFAGAAPAPSRVATGGGRHGACVGDYDADGLLDVFVGGERRHRLFHNMGGGRFVDLLHQSGEIEYIPKPGAIRPQTGDVNNDGRQDVLVVYGVQLSPHLFFNRGFRSFGHARELDLQIEGRLPEASLGQQGGCLGDFNGDGALDMVLALMNGELWVFYREVDNEFAMAATAALSPESPWPGPINVAAWAGEPPRALGTCVVRPGGPPALWGVPESEAGDVTIRWRTPDGAVQTRVVEVVPGDEPKHVFLGEPDRE